MGIQNAKLYAEAIEGARIAEQMRLAGVIQRRMIPEKAPVIRGLDIAATYTPCFDVGGDFYDFFRISEDSIVVVIADVIGKGIPAAIMMSMFRGAVRAYAESKGRAEVIENIVEKLNKMACYECRDGEFISLFYSVVNFKKMTVSYCNCGHEPPVLIRKRRIIDLEKGGLVLGVERQVEYETESFGLKEGDCLLFYTDGLIDAANFDGDFWGRERMLESAKKFASEPAELMVKDILRYRRRFVGLARQIDDTSIVVVRVDKTAGLESVKEV